MFEVQCLDSYGNTINYFTQWDVDQKIIIPIDSRSLQNAKLPSSPAYALPEVHFGNSARSETLLVRSDFVDAETISVDVPNILLQEPYPLFVYVYLTDPEDVSSQKIILQNEIPVRKRQKPSDYFYIENIRRITAEMIKEEIEAVVDETRQREIGLIEQTRTEAKSNIDSTEATASKKVDEARDSAVKLIGDTATNAKNTVDNQMNKDYNEGSITVGEGDAACTYTGGFINIGNDIISELNAIKNNSLTEYNETVTKADETQSNIETSIEETMTENGLTVQPADDGEGNVNIVILISQSSEQ